MMSTNREEKSPVVQIELTHRFQSDLHSLAKRYRRIRIDLQSLIGQLQAGNTPGDRISGVNYTVFKVRLKNSDIPKGKSGGYRVIYYVQTAEKVILATMYSKSDQTDIDKVIIRQIITQYEEQQG